MALNETLFEAMAGEFNDADTDIRDAIAEQAELQVDSSKFRAKTDLAVVLLTAHMMKLNPAVNGTNGNAAGPLKRHKVGNIEKEYFNSFDESGSDIHELKTTVYGREFLRLRRQISTTPLIY